MYARKEQKKNSEIEFLVGFPANTPWSKVHRTLHIVERDLPVALGRPVDALDMRDGELREYIELDALESSKRVYGHPNWSAGCLHASAKLILDAHRKIIRVGDLMVEIGKLITSKVGSFTSSKFILYVEILTPRRLGYGFVGDCLSRTFRAPVQFGCPCLGSLPGSHH